VTVDELIAALERAKAGLPAGGQTPVAMPNMLEVLRVAPNAATGVVVLADWDEQGRKRRVGGECLDDY